MNALFLNLKDDLIFLLLAICVLLGIGVWGYHGMYRTTKDALNVQSAAIKTQNDEATKRLAALNASVLAQQKTIDARYEAQEHKDEAVKEVLDQAARDAVGKPVAVRVRNDSACGPGRGAQPGQASAAAVPGQADANTSAGVLAPEAARRLGSSIAEIELLQAAFNSCKGTE